MSTSGEFYQSLPPVSKFYGVACLMTTGALHLGLYDSDTTALYFEGFFKCFQVWRLITNFFLIAPFSLRFAFLFISIAEYSVSLESGAFDKSTADYVWMLIFGALCRLVMGVILILWLPFNGLSMVFMILYVWGREYPDDPVKFYRVVTLKGFYMPWASLGLDLIIGFDIKPGILGIVVGHLCYFLTVLHPLSGGKYIFKTLLWVYKLVALGGEGVQLNSPLLAFRGRSCRLNGTRTQTSTPAQQSQATSAASAQQPGSGNGVAFRGRSYRLDGR